MDSTFERVPFQTASASEISQRLYAKECRISKSQHRPTFFTGFSYILHGKVNILLIVPPEMVSDRISQYVRLKHHSEERKVNGPPTPKGQETVVNCDPGIQKLRPNLQLSMAPDLKNQRYNDFLVIPISIEAVWQCLHVQMLHGFLI